MYVKLYRTVVLCVVYSTCSPQQRLLQSLIASLFTSKSLFLKYNDFERVCENYFGAHSNIWWDFERWVNPPWVNSMTGSLGRNMPGNLNACRCGKLWLCRRAAFPLSKGNSRQQKITYSNLLPSPLDWYALAAQWSYPPGLCALSGAPIFSPVVGAAGGGGRNGSLAARRFTPRGRRVEQAPLSPGKTPLHAGPNNCLYCRVFRPCGIHTIEHDSFHIIQRYL